MAATEFFVIPATLLDTATLPGPMARVTSLVREGGYLTAARMLQELHTEELQPMVDALLFARQSVPAYVPVALFTALLAGHEGLVVVEDERIATWMTQLLLLLQLEQQVRAGTVLMDYAKVTLEYAGLAGLPLAEGSPAKLSDLQLRFLEEGPNG